MLMENLLHTAPVSCDIAGFSDVMCGMHAHPACTVHSTVGALILCNLKLFTLLRKRLKILDKYLICQLFTMRWALFPVETGSIARWTLFFFFFLFFMDFKDF